ncbi:MAG: type 4a pilus biogenesis protein PilO [Dactylosporangium sp.]|nr:type 4a pilus biogenesis protein PilO [Dactylosporangium sp.]NNJ63188.1 type 4a pilus biogenesis protein PilO [Dactylosporangium sp.]
MGRLRPDRLWAIAGAAAALLLLALGWFVLIGPKYEEAVDVHDQASVAETQVGVLERRLVELRQQNRDLQQYQERLTTDRQALPTTPALADFLRQLQAAGSATSVTVSGLIVGAPSTLTAAGNQVFSLPITLTVDGRTDGLTGFLDELQLVRPRAVLITSINAIPQGQAGSFTDTVTLTVTLQAFVASDLPADVGVEGDGTAPTDPDGAGE